MTQVKLESLPPSVMDRVVELTDIQTVSVLPCVNLLEPQPMNVISIMSAVDHSKTTVGINKGREEVWY